jgi:uncharacterized protein involved in tolerance to divalent cations
MLLLLRHAAGIFLLSCSVYTFLRLQVKQLHPYDEPEVIALPVVGGSASYMAWVRDSTANAKHD